MPLSWTIPAAPPRTSRRLLRSSSPPPQRTQSLSTLASIELLHSSPQSQPDARDREARRHPHHPNATLVLVLPLLALYELANLLAAHGGLAHPPCLRAGADLWTRAFLASLAWPVEWVSPSLILAAFLGLWRSWRFQRSDAPPGLCPPYVALMVECVVWGLALFGLAHLVLLGFVAVGDWNAAVSQAAVTRPHTPPPPDPAGWSWIGLVGAGVFEEAIFRGLGLPILVVMFQALRWRADEAWIGAALISSALFAMAHHVGPLGEPIEPTTLTFRFLAGMVFAGLSRFRGFGIAVGGHVSYNLTVAILVL